VHHARRHDAARRAAYTGNWLSKAAGDAPHTQHNAVCLETQNYPDAVNKPGVFPSPAWQPGETYSVTTVHKFEW
jgi:aldose 1-epimerase